jgi:hypothetical protein
LKWIFDIDIETCNECGGAKNAAKNADTHTFKWRE